MRVTENTGSTVTVQMEADEAAKLSGAEGIASTLAVQVRLREAITTSWFEASCPTPPGEPS